MDSASQSSQYYLKRKKKYLRDFDRIMKSGRRALGDHFEAREVPEVSAEARQEFESLLAQVPYVGGEMPFTDFLVSTAMALAVYRVGQRHGKTLEEVSALLYHVFQDYLEATPKFLLRLFSRMDSSPRFLKKVRERAVRSQRREYPGNYVFEFVPGDGVNFDYGVDYLECGCCKFLAAHGALELAPSICAADILYSEMLGWGLVRTETLADGGGRCDFRFKPGGPTRVAVSGFMQEIVARAS